MALVATAVTVVVAEGWYAYEEAAACGSSWTSMCLAEFLLGALVVVAASPVLLYLAYRLAGVRRPLLSVLVALAAGVLLLALSPLTRDVAALADVAEPHLDGQGSSWALAVVVGPAVLAGGLVWSGPRRAVRAATAAVALAALGASAVLLQPAADAARDRREVVAAATPLVIAPGWQWLSPYDGQARLDYDVVPTGTVDMWDSLRVEVSTDLDEEGSVCGFTPCRQVGDVLVSEPTDGAGTVTAWRVLDGHLVEVTAYDPEDDPDPVAFLTAARVADLETFLAARTER